MGETEQGNISQLPPQRTLLLAAVAAVVIIAVFFVFFRGCARGRAPELTTLYSNLELKDSANVVAKLKELKIPYEIKEDGHAVAVPKDRADEARISLAQENLPAGGSVGWEIFDETRLGATDFDRRVQLIRAISGELSRTIRYIDAVENARVQIVIPKTELFEVEKAPVTASVLLKLRPGRNLSSRQIRGIVNLVASSVENLSPANVTIVDIYGNIMTPDKGEIVTTPAPTGPPAPPIVVVPGEGQPAVPSTPAPVAPVKPATPEVVSIPNVLTPEERVVVLMKAREELEDRLTNHVQTLLNKFYPQGTVITRINVDLALPGQAAAAPAPKRYIKRGRRYVLAPAPAPAVQVQGGVIKKITAIVLVDNRLDVDKSLKENTFATVAAATGLTPSRGDRIELRKVPFQAALPPVAPTPPAPKPSSPRPSGGGIPRWVWIIGGLIVAILVLRRIRSQRLQRAYKTPPISSGYTPSAATAASSAGPAASPSSPGPMLSEIRQLADENPERIADLLKSWLSEEARR